MANGYYLQDHAAEVRSMFLAPEDGPAMFRSYEVEERTQSAYVQVDMDFGEKLHAQAGVRYSQVDTPIEFNNLVLAGQPETAASSSVDDIMPSLTLRYDVTDSFRLRAQLRRDVAPAGIRRPEPQLHA